MWPPATSSRPSGRNVWPEQNRSDGLGTEVNVPVAGSHSWGPPPRPQLSSRPSYSRWRWSCTIGEGITDDHWPTAAAPDAAVTVILAVASFPSLVAVIVALPAATPVTRPLADTVAAAGVSVDHVTVRPVSGCPAASFGVAVSCTEAPDATVAEAGVTTIDATGLAVAVTVTRAVPLLPSLVPVMVAAPAPTPVTRPLLDTVATWALSDVQVTVRLIKGSPPGPSGAAVSWTVFPTTSPVESGDTSTDATGVGPT